MLPPKDRLTICIAHVAYRMQDRWALRNTGISSFEVRDRALDNRVAEADVLLYSGLWRNDLNSRTPRRRFIQSISAGVDQYDKAALAAAGIRLASAQRVNARAASEHAMALILALARRLPEARDNQAQRFWRGMLGDLSRREDALGRKTLLTVGPGRIGDRLAKLARAFDMHVLGTRRDPAAGGGAREIYGMQMEAMTTLLPQADVVALTCPLAARGGGALATS
jgi:phosphoglycerate dehydrogenase-like enzyme